MKLTTSCLIAALVALLALSVSVAPSQAGKYRGDCMAWYNAAQHALARGDHDGYRKGLKHFNNCLAQSAGKSPHIGAPKGKKKQKQH